MQVAGEQQLERGRLAGMFAQRGRVDGECLGRPSAGGAVAVARGRRGLVKTAVHQRVPQPVFLKRDK